MATSGSVRSATLVAVCALLCVARAAAQPARSDSVPLPSVFVGTGIGPATNDAASRMRLFEEGRATVWLVEAGAAVSERVGIGVEYSQPSAATAFTTVGAGRAQIAGRQEERVLLGLLRARLTGVNRWALDVVGGAIVLFQHHETVDRRRKPILICSTGSARWPQGANSRWTPPQSCRSEASSSFPAPRSPICWPTHTPPPWRRRPATTSGSAAPRRR